MVQAVSGASSAPATRCELSTLRLVVGALGHLAIPVLAITDDLSIDDRARDQLRAPEDAVALLRSRYEIPNRGLGDPEDLADLPIGLAERDQRRAFCLAARKPGNIAVVHGVMEIEARPEREAGDDLERGHQRWRDLDRFRAGEGA